MIYTITPIILSLIAFLIGYKLTDGYWNALTIALGVFILSGAVSALVWFLIEFMRAFE